jgi:hypothetical protein
MPRLRKARVVQRKRAEENMAQSKKKKTPVPTKGIDPRINNNDAELHQTEAAADDRARIREQAGRGSGNR